MPRFIRVLIVDDSALIRQMLARALSMDPRIQIVGTAKTGVEAIERARELDPDVITLDIEMPQMTGLEALPYIRKHTDARVVILSSLDDADTTYRAMSLGAIDFIPKPAGVASTLTELTEQLLKAIKTASRVSPEAAAEAMRDHGDPACVDGLTATGAPCEPSRASRVEVCVAIAASTGGPPVLERVFKGLIGTLPAAYVIVQHLPAGFSASLARRLTAAGEVKVVEAEDGEIIRPGCGYLARHGRHLTIEPCPDGHRLVYVDAPTQHGVRPAADLLFDSVATCFEERSVGVVLTGMGADGAAGALKIRLAGGDTVAQDEASSVVWGMPSAALRAGAVTRMVASGLVAAEIRRAVRARTEGAVS